MPPVRATILASLVTIAAIAPLSVSAQSAVVPVASSATLQQELQSLLAQISALEAAATTSANASISTSIPVQSVIPATLPGTISASAQSGIICPAFARTLARGSSGTDVANLQGFLAQNPLIYPEASVTAYFGMLTQDAVQRWQSAYHIVSSGTPASTGYGVVGPHTAAAITASCANNTDASTNQSSGVSTNSAQEPLCPIAAEPATPCPGTWSPITNTTGCTIAWQCAVPLSEATSAPPVSTSVSSSASTSPSSICAAYTLPSCTNGTIQWLGMSSANCNLGYQCIQSGQ
jgi:peptidoglycan hydrolase-like protein with peptidoglycan-binding domain